MTEEATIEAVTAVLRRGGWEFRHDAISLCLFDQHYGKRFISQAILFAGWSKADTKWRDAVIARLEMAGYEFSPIAPEKGKAATATVELADGSTITAHWHPKAEAWLAPVPIKQFYG